MDVPPPLPPCGVLDGAWRLPESLDELLLPEDELPEELPVLPEPLVPELALEDPVELDDEPVPVAVTAAWLDPGRITATAPAASTLAADTVTVAAVSRRRPRSRSATACATRRAPLGSFGLFTSLVLHAPLDALSVKRLRLF